MEVAPKSYFIIISELLWINQGSSGMLTRLYSKNDRKIVLSATVGTALGLKVTDELGHGC